MPWSHACLTNLPLTWGRLSNVQLSCSSSTSPELRRGSYSVMKTCISQYSCSVHFRNYYILGNFWGRKLSRISRFCSYSQKFSPQNWGCGVFWWRHQRATHEIFLSTNLIFHPFMKVFSLSLLYGNLHISIISIFLKVIPEHACIGTSVFLLSKLQ